MKSWVDTLRRRWRAFVRRHVVVDDPYEEAARLPHAALFIVNGHMMDLEGLRAWAHGAMFPRSVRRQTWN